MVRISGKFRELAPSGAIWESLLPLGLAFLPFPYFVGVTLVGFLGLCLYQTYSYPRLLLTLLGRWGFLAIAAGLLISARFAAYPGEAYLQTAHFLPFFWVWAAIVVYLKATPNPWQQLYRWALILVLTALPLSLVGIAEYVLKRSPLTSPLSEFPLINWLYIGDLGHPRTFSLFDYPNTLANYLVMVLGLNLGLMFLRSGGDFLGRSPRWLKGLLAINSLLILLCLYCSGSRNGYLVAAALLLGGIFFVPSHRWIKALGISGLVLIVVTTAQFGLAGRQLSWRWFTDDPRVEVWRFALQLIQQRPLLGHGLGNYKLLYDGEVPGYDFIAHAHNLWLMLSAEAGIPIAIVLTVTVGLMCYRSSRALMSLRSDPNQYALLLGYSLCFYSSVLFSLFDITFFEVRVNLLGWFSLAVLFCSPEICLHRLVPRHVDSAKE